MVETLSAPRLKSQDFLTVADLSTQELVEVLDYAAYLKRLRKSGTPHRLLEGKSVAMYFEKPSNRTRVSFEVGIADLGAHPVMLRKDEVNLGVRETIADTARTLSRYVDAIMIRTFAQSEVEELAQYATVPVINGLTDEHHPCQIVADLLTVKERLGEFRGRKLVFIGDGNNIAHSLLEGCALVGMDVTIACPASHHPLPDVLQKVEKIAIATGSKISVTDNVLSASEGASVLYTDVWASMGQEQEIAERQRVFQGFQINDKVLGVAAPDAIILHCLPAHRGEEITPDAFEKHAGVIFDQAENRLHAQKAVMVSLLS
jgi:ornithine carbamoyltransferase